MEKITELNLIPALLLCRTIKKKYIVCIWMKDQKNQFQVIFLDKIT